MDNMSGEYLTNRGPRMRRLPEPKLVWQLLPDANDNAQAEASCENLIKNPVDVAFVDKNLFAVADSEGHKIVLFDIERLEWTEIGREKVWPNAIAVTPGGDLVVTDRKRKAVVQYDLEGHQLNTFDVYIEEGVEEGYETACYPHGIAVTSQGEIVVTDTGPNTIKIFSPDGGVIKEIGSKGTDLGQLNLPFYCAVDNQDNIIISDNMNYCVKVFDHNGNCRSQIGSEQGWGGRKFDCPYGVCADFENNVVVADYDKNLVSLFTSEIPDGRIIKHVLTKPRDMCVSPCGVAVGPCGHLVVTEGNLDYTNIKVYKLYE